MACGCKKKKKTVPAVPTPMAAFAMAAQAGELDKVLSVRCTNCVGLLQTYNNEYIPFNTGEFYAVYNSDLMRWRSQGWMFEVMP